MDHVTKTQKAIDEAFNFMAAIPVAGDNVEIMAAARDALRRAYALAADKPAADKPEGEADGG